MIQSKKIDKMNLREFLIAHALSGTAGVEGLEAKLAERAVAIADAVLARLAQEPGESPPPAPSLVGR